MSGAKVKPFFDIPNKNGVLFQKSFIRTSTINPSFGFFIAERRIIN